MSILVLKMSRSLPECLGRPATETGGLNSLRGPGEGQISGLRPSDFGPGGGGPPLILRVATLAGEVTLSVSLGQGR